MTKNDAIKLFGDSVETANALGITLQAVHAWPDPLPRRIADRVLGAAVRAGIEIPNGLKACEAKTA